jgi:uncharacterized protein (DUF58 family)
MAVLPNSIFKQIRRLQMRARRMVATSFGGEYQSAFKGTGLLFEDVREYQPGDDVRRIDWNVTARIGLPFVKRYTEERELTVLLVIDFSAGMNFGSGLLTKRSVAAELGAVLSLCATSCNDRVGLLTYTDHVEKYVRPSKGGSHVLSMIRDTLFFTPKGKTTNHRIAFDYINRIHRKRAIIFWISDGHGELPLELGKMHDNTPEVNFLRRTSFRHEMICIQIEDPRERSWPDIGLTRLIDAETDEIRLVDTSSKTFREQFVQKTKEKSLAFEQMCQQSRIDLLRLDTNGNHLEELLKFFRNRSKRIKSA